MESSFYFPLNVPPSLFELVTFNDFVCPSQNSLHLVKHIFIYLLSVHKLEHMKETDVLDTVVHAVILVTLETKARGLQV